MDTRNLRIPPYLGNAFDIRLDRNYAGLTIVPEEIFERIELQWLNLDYNRLTDLPDKFSIFKRLKWLFLEGNRFQDFPQIICQLENISVLNLSANKLHSVPSGIKNFRFLRWLDLSGNKFTELPSEITCSELHLLERLHMKDNHIKVIPDQICELRSLQSLWLENNHICDLPESMAKLDNLEELHLQQNAIHRLPKAWSRGFRKLISLKLSNNPLLKRYRDLVPTISVTEGDDESQEILLATKSAINLKNLKHLVDGDVEVSYQRMEGRKNPLGASLLCTCCQNIQISDLFKRLVDLNLAVRVFSKFTQDYEIVVKSCACEDYSFHDYFFATLLYCSEHAKSRAAEDVNSFLQSLSNCKTLSGKPKLIFVEILTLSPQELTETAAIAEKIRVDNDDFLINVSRVLLPTRYIIKQEIYRLVSAYLNRVLESIKQSRDQMHVMQAILEAERKLQTENIDFVSVIFNTLKCNLFLN